MPEPKRKSIDQENEQSVSPVDRRGRGQDLPEVSTQEQRPSAKEAEFEMQSKKEAEHFLSEDEPQSFGDAVESFKSKLKRPKKKKVSDIPQVRDQVTVQVEQIMEQGLEEAYKELSTIEQQEFKMKGEETALQIRDLLRATHIKVQKIFKLLMEWLKLLPGINKFFLEQEAKIKADKIITLKEITSAKMRRKK